VTGEAGSRARPDGDIVHNRCRGLDILKDVENHPVLGFIRHCSGNMNEAVLAEDLQFRGLNQGMNVAQDRLSSLEQLVLVFIPDGLDRRGQGRLQKLKMQPQYSEYRIQKTE